MAQLQSDQHGFLVGNPIDLGRMPKYLLDIKSDVAAIRRAVVGSPGSAKQRTANIPATLPSRDASGRFVRNSDNSSAPSKNKSSETVATPIGSKKTADSASGDNGKAIEKALVDRLRPVFNKSAVTPQKRDASGKFTGDGEGSGSRDGSPGAVTALANRLSALAGIGSGMEEADPTIKAFKEVAEPMKRGFEFLGGGKDDKQTKWLRNIFGVLNVFRKDETVYQKATQKTLKAIEGKPVGGRGDGDSGGVMTIFAARLGPALLTGITAVLGFIFSPIGLAIGAASALRHASRRTTNSASA